MQAECEISCGSNYCEAYGVCGLVTKGKKESMVQVTTYISTLMGLAYDVGKARKEGDHEAIIKAQYALDDYEAAVLASDTVVLDCDRPSMHYPRPR